MNGGNGRDIQTDISTELFPQGVRRGFNAVRDRAGLGKEVSPYAIRHTIAIELRKRGVPPWEVQGILGHKAGGYGTTEIYAKYDPDYLSKSVAAIDDYMKEISLRVKRPLDLNRLKLRVNCVRAAEKCRGPETSKPPGEPEGFNGGAKRDRTADLYNAIGLYENRKRLKSTSCSGAVSLYPE